MEPVKQITILLVEDDPGDQKLTKKAVSDAKIVSDIMVVDNGEAAFEYLSHCKDGNKKYPRPDLILLDLNMPGIGGKEFLRRIKTDDDFGMIPIVVLTTSDLDNDIRESYRLHASGYIKKPVTLQGFQKIMQELQEYWFNICKMA